MSTEELRKAVEAVELRFTSGNSVPVERATVRDHEWQTIRQALRDQEAEIAGYRTLIDLLRTDKSGTKRDYVESRAGTMVRITAHLGGEQ